MKARTKAKDLTTRKDAKGGIIAVLIGLKQAPGFPGGVTVAAGDVNGDGNAPKLNR